MDGIEFLDDRSGNNQVTRSESLSKYENWRSTSQ